MFGRQVHDLEYPVGMGLQSGQRLVQESWKWGKIVVGGGGMELMTMDGKSRCSIRLMDRFHRRHDRLIVRKQSCRGRHVSG